MFNYFVAYFNTFLVNKTSFDIYLISQFYFFNIQMSVIKMALFCLKISTHRRFVPCRL